MGAGEGPACLLLLEGQGVAMQVLVELGTGLMGVAVGVIAARLVLQGILAVTFGRRA